MEVAQNRFPLPPEGEPPLMPIELLQYIVINPVPDLRDEPHLNIIWTPSFRHFLLLCLERNSQQRPSPRQMLLHPWVDGMAKRKTNMARWVAEVWEA